MHTPVSRFSTLAIFRILSNLSYSPDQGRIRCHRGDYIFAAILWPWAVDYIRPSSWDVVGVAVALLHGHHCIPASLNSLPTFGENLENKQPTAGSCPLYPHHNSGAAQPRFADALCRDAKPCHQIALRQRYQ
ncbi:MAG: hypothetical protein EBU77_09025 [Betaproteobacteria bacterium]|nr:hypothetical protein [Betaproteobacteria bacterium]